MSIYCCVHKVGPFDSKIWPLGFKAELNEFISAKKVIGIKSVNIGCRVHIMKLFKNFNNMVFFLGRVYMCNATFPCNFKVG